MLAKWRQSDIAQALFTRRMLICVAIGFSSGLPLYILVTLVPAWLRTEGVDLKTIGLMALIQLPYTWKFLWAPFMDRFSIPWLGRRRGWMLIAQVALFFSILFTGWFSPAESLQNIIYLCCAVAFFSATQDIAIDAYRRELLSDAELGLGNSIHVNAYRVAGLIPGSLALILADQMAWQSVFEIVAVFMLVGIIATCLVSEPNRAVPPRTLQEAVVEPFQEFLSRRGWQSALLIIAFIFLYKIGDNMATALATPFYLDMGFSNTEIGLIAKHAGLWPAIFGGFLGGLIMVRIGINRALWVFGFVQMFSILGFALLAESGKSNLLLALVIGLEYLGVGLGTAAFTAFIARATHPKYTATQFALFTAFAAQPRTLANASVGYWVESLGWTQFFLVCTALAIPGMLLLIAVAPWNEKNNQNL